MAIFHTAPNFAQTNDFSYIVSQAQYLGPRSWLMLGICTKRLYAGIWASPLLRQKPGSTGFTLLLTFPGSLPCT